MHLSCVATFVILKSRADLGTGKQCGRDPPKARNSRGRHREADDQGRIREGSGKDQGRARERGRGEGLRNYLSKA